MNDNKLQRDDAVEVPEGRERTLDDFSREFGSRPSLFLSAPGRTELGGNHTDHNRGVVLAAAVSLDTRAAISPADDSRVTVLSDGFGIVHVDIRDLRPRSAERHSSAALIRGIAARLLEIGYRVGGFNARVTSDIAVGSGLSSSAAFEVLIAGAFNILFNRGEIPPETLAAAGRFAENVFFGKPCGLMDQLCSALGGAMRIDFAAPDAPLIRKVAFRPDVAGYSLMLVNTGRSHADLTADYAAIPREMEGVARALGGTVARDIDASMLLGRLDDLRRQCGDRAVLRCLHFLDENERVDAQAEALEKQEFERFLELVSDSGESSLRLLQNGYSAADPGNQGVILGLALTERFLRRGGPGACRVHGGGFAGTIQSYVPLENAGAYRAAMEEWFGKGAVTEVVVRTQGLVCEPVKGD